VNRRAIPLALLSAALFGLSTPLAKPFLATSSPQILAGLLYLGSGLGLGILMLARRLGSRTPAGPGLTRADLPWLGGAILAGGVVGPLLLMLGLARTTASSASLLLNLEGVFTAALAWLVFRENADRRIVLGMLVIVIGGIILSWPGQLTWEAGAGPLLVAGACFAWGIDNNLTQRVSHGDSMVIAASKGLVAGPVNLGIGLTLGGALPEAASLAGILAVGFAGYGVSLVLFVLSLRHLGTARTGAYFSSAPFLGAAAGILVWGDPVTLPLVVAALLMAAGLAIHLVEKHEHPHVHEPMEHSHRHVHDEHHRHDHSPDDPPGEPHTHRHRHERLVHTHPHYPDIHHRHRHGPHPEAPAGARGDTSADAAAAVGSGSAINR
jgi:drug/metabolite transporter (DMT)-like permease